MNPSLLFVSSKLYEEAVSILYGVNTFDFKCREGWANFICFARHLTPVSTNSILKLTFDFPDLGRVKYQEATLKGYYGEYDTKFDRDVKQGLEIIRDLPNLQDLYFCVDDHIVSKHLGILNEIYRSQAKNCCTVVLRIGRIFRSNPPLDEGQSVEICDYFVEKMQSWGLGD